MDNASVISVLSAQRFFADLPEQTRILLTGLATLRSFAAGAVLFHEGAACQELFVVAAGHVALDMSVPGRGPVRILTVGPGELLGWSPLLGGGNMTAAATALQDSTVIALPGAALRDMCAADHDFGYRVMRQVALALSQRLVATRLQLLDLFSGLGRHA